MNKFDYNVGLIFFVVKTMEQYQKAQQTLKSSDGQNFDEDTVIPHPNIKGMTITLKELKTIQSMLKSKMDLESTITEADIKYIAGIDIGHHKTEKDTAKVVITVFNYETMEEVYRDSEIVTLTFPYIAGFLGFREVPHYMTLLNRLKDTHPEFYPDMLMVDGNGYLHYYSFGCACHIGVIAGIPSIGVAKTLYCHDGLSFRTFKGVKKSQGNYQNLVGDSGTIWGRAVWNSKGASNCLFVSQGNRVSLDEATKIVIHCSKFRIPEPIRQADIMSKVF